MYVLWKGPSRLDGKTPIAVIATGYGSKSANRKTGDMIQTWIIRTDIEPHVAVKNGDDAAICGDCPFRAGQGCYVTTFQAPLAVYRAFHRGSYERPKSLESAGENRALRIGSYGDPAAAPLHVWHRFTSRALTWTGYTHAWRTAPEGLSEYCMASVESTNGASDASVMSYRSFRVSGSSDPVKGSEVACPAYTHGVACADCGLCQGNVSSGRSIVAAAHGNGKRKALLSVTA